MSSSRLPANIDELLRRLAFIRNKKQEYVICFSVDGAGCIISRRIVTIGLLDVSMTHPREVFAGPLKDRAAAVVIAHNHPWGSPEPSRRDIETTQQLVAAAQLLGIVLQDHLIVTSQAHFSFRVKGLM